MFIERRTEHNEQSSQMISKFGKQNNGKGLKERSLKRWIIFEMGNFGKGFEKELVDVEIKGWKFLSRMGKELKTK